MLSTCNPRPPSSEYNVNDKLVVLSSWSAGLYLAMATEVSLRISELKDEEPVSSSSVVEMMSPVSDATLGPGSSLELLDFSKLDLEGESHTRLVHQL